MIAENRQTPVNLVLSAGRTGTVFLTNLLEQVSGVHVVHEPFPARYELMLGNMRNDIGIGKSLARKLFLSVRKNRFSNGELGHKYIEINPLMCPLVDLLKELDRPLNVVHMVRDPLSWVKSIDAFRASKFVRPFYPLIPFSTPFPTPRPEGWKQMSHVERQLCRWRFCNEQILSQRPHYARYALVRYEDLFSEQPEVRMENLKKVFETLQVPMDSVDTTDVFKQRKNSAPNKPIATVDRETVATICGSVSEQFGYA